MYKRKESSNGGSYYPAFLCLDVNTPDDLYYIGHYPLDERTEAIFLHEYIHYLQDLTTIAGLARIETIVDQIKWICAQASKHKKLKIPQHIDTWAYNMLPNANSLKICKGDFYIIDDSGNKILVDITSIVSFEKEKTRILYTSGQSYSRDIVCVLTFKDENGIIRKYKVGEMAISESMAFLIEHHLYPDVLVKPTHCPYFVVKKIAEWKLKRTLDDLTLIALCDVSLLCSLPGYALYEILDFFATHDIEITPALVYCYGLGTIMSNKLSRTRSWEDELSYIMEIANKQFCDLFIHPYWTEFRSVTKCAFDAGLEIRKNIPTLFLDIAKNGKIAYNKPFQKCLNELGCLAVKNKSNEIYSILPVKCKDKSLDPDWLISLHQFYNILFTNTALATNSGKKIIEKECDLKYWCRKSFIRKGEKDLTSESYNCSYFPWLNVSKTDLRQCSFGRLWATFGFDRIKMTPK